MELKEGMYVRTKLNDFCNIVVIRKIDEFDYDDNNYFWIDDYIIDIYGDEQNRLCKDDISKASFNIIDLIEVGDYVNGLRINSITEVDENHDVRLVWNLTTYGLRINSITEVDENHDVRLVRNLTTYGDNDISFSNEEIKSIVTKEQFESVKYKVE